MRVNSLRSSAVIAAGLASLPLLGSPAAACDTRHFYNNSPVTFQLTTGNNTRCSIGPLSMQQICQIPPGQTADIHYGSFFPNIGVSTPGSPIFPGDGYSVDPASCRINHSGSTGNIVVNEPADGDVVTCGKPDYPCR